MEGSNLNKAHHFYRMAEMEMNAGRFGKAIDAHKKAIEYLELACGDTDNRHAIESLNLQKDWHFRQIRILEKKRRIQEQHEQIQKLAALSNNTNPSSDDEDGDENKNPIQVAIVQTMKETDNLLKLLINKSSGGNSDSESLKSFSTTDTDEKLVSFDGMDNSNSNALTGLKQPKDDTFIIEELRILNGQLQSLVDQLVRQLKKSTKEVDVLKRQINRLEYEKMKAATQSGNTNNLKVTTDSSGATSPYVFTPSSELSPDVHDAQVLPMLAPLENSSLPILTHN